MFHRFRITRLAVYLGVLFGGLTFPLPSAFGQNLSGGLDLGFNASQVDGDFSGGFNQAGIRVGAYVGYSLSSKVELEAHLLFEQLGSADQDRGGLIVRTNYFSLPVLGKFFLPVQLGQQEQTVHILIGPAPAILLSAKDQDGEFTGLNSLDIRGLAGLGLPLGGSSISLLYGYSLGSLAGKSSGNPLLQPNARGLFHNHVSLTFHLKLGTS